jgi:hypothetical protein
MAYGLLTPFCDMQASRLTPLNRCAGNSVGRLILIVTVALLPLLIVDVPQWLFVLSQIIWGSGMYIGISVA